MNDPDGHLLGAAPGLPDDAYEHDGLITKATIRAAALAALRPAPAQVLWDVGTGAGSVAVEWARLGGTAYGVERDPVRAARARANALRLAPPGSVSVVEGPAAQLVGTLPPPDAVFVGGGADPDVLACCHGALSPGGRLVAHAVTLETEEVLVAAFRRYGGELVRLNVELMEPLGRLHGWRPLRPVVQWAVHRDTSQG